MPVAVICVEGLQIVPYVHGIQLAVAVGDGEDLVTGGLHSAGFMAVDVSGVRGDNALIWMQHGVDDDLIGLGAAGDEKHVGVRTGAGGADLFLGGVAVAVLAISGELFQIGFQQVLQNGLVGTFSVVTFKRQHENFSFIYKIRGDADTLFYRYQGGFASGTVHPARKLLY